MQLRMTLLAVSAIASGCGNYYGTRDFGLTPTTDALNDGAGDCADVENCINLDINETAVLTRGEWILGRKNNDQIGYIKVRNGASLFIEPGTTIRGLENSALIVTRGSQLYAEGEPEAPIVFTSAQPVGTRTSGFWGGVLLLGNGISNEGEQPFEALDEVDPDALYGGNDNNDSSGVLRYVRIEFAGFAYREGQEFNGLTFAGVGRGTRVDHIQVHRSSDDGIEFFGGNVDLKYVVSSQNEDDGFDTDNGYSGRTQYLVVQHTNGRSSDPNGYESDNQPADGNFNATPRTHPTISNATLIGTDATQGPDGNPVNSFGMILRRGTSGQYVNHIVMSFRNTAIDLRDTATTASYPAQLSVRNSVFFSNAGDANFIAETNNNDGGFDEAAEFLDPSTNNVVADPRLGNPTSNTAPNFFPQALIPGTAPPADDFFDANANFAGAMGSTDWTVGWTSFPEN